MTEEVIVKIQGMHRAAEEMDDMSTITTGRCKCIRGNYYIKYEEQLEDSGETASNILKIMPSEGSFELTKRGACRTNMVFRAGEQTKAAYETPYGTLVMGITTRQVELEETKQRIVLCAVYELEMNGSRVSECELRIEISTK